MALSYKNGAVYVADCTMKETLERLKLIFEGITCLCAEGPEVLSKLELTAAINKESDKGFAICEVALVSEDNYCPECGEPVHFWAAECNVCGAVWD